MQLLWVASLSLFVVTIIRRHGWEYVPLVVLLGVARWYTDTRQYGGALADGFFLASIRQAQTPFSEASNLESVAPL